ncbi:type IV secretory system conjugative DNA transfer family protein [Methylobacterium sp. J-030]|uniref:type IV secretory system conjugative DNA transfer family protein n=1 Tax=Methylobacterium sp. J-030 TaxID=2836627 RepID=UPI001FB94FF1|nr:type IV secretory system conjugative DNA transfer family protein [Methylobacterium sp. J-030]MCJ2069699.1 type IV secretory system conjugative DNA transfer family protein [Methylobacterium sp. J-030]
MSALSIASRLLPAPLALAAWLWGGIVWEWLFAQAALNSVPLGLRGGEALFRLVDPFVVVAFCIWAHRQAALRRSAVFAALFGTVVAIGLTIWPEWQRLAVYCATMPPGAVLRMAGGAEILAAILGPFGLLIALCLLGPDPFAKVAPAVTRAASDNHGHADWASMAQARQRFPGPDPRYGGIVVGEAYRVDRDPGATAPFDPDDRGTWGRGGTAPLLIDPCRTGPSHAIVFAGSGGFKSTAVAIPTLLTWTGSCVVLDPSRELGPMLTSARLAMGHRVVTLDPTDPASGSIDVLAAIDPASPAANAQVEMITALLCGDPPPERASSGASAVFQDLSKTLVACLLADMIWDPALSPGERTLRTLRQRVVTPEAQMRDLLAGIHDASASSKARDLAGTLMGLVDETFSGAYANAARDTRWLSDPTYAALVSGGGIDMRQLRDGRVTIFVQIPLDALRATPGLARVVIGSLLDAVYRADGAVEGRTLFLLDEVAQLGRMRILETARDAGRKYKITMLLLYQALGQVSEQWGMSGKNAWYASTSWRAYAAVQDPETAEEVSRLCGGFGVEATSRGESRGTSGQAGGGGSTSTGHSETRAELRRALIEPAELLQDARTDEVFVFVGNARPLRCGRALYFRRREMIARVAANRFRSAAPVQAPPGRTARTGPNTPRLPAAE